MAMNLPSSNLGFNILFALIALLMLYTALPYVGLFVLAFVWMVITYPWFVFFCRHLKNRVLAAIVTTLASVSTLLIPLYLFLLSAINQFSTFFSGLQLNLNTNPSPLVALQERIDSVAPFLNITKNADVYLQNIASAIQSFAISLASGSVFFIVNTVFFIIAVIYFYLEREHFLHFLKKILPLPKQESATLVDNIVSSTNIIILSIALSAFAQAVATVIALAFLGVPTLLFWFFAILFAACLPLGAGLVTVPMSIVLILLGNFWSGLILLLWHVFGVSSLDNIIRGQLFKKGAIRLPELVTLIATLGGIMTFGFFGVIYGPLIAIIFIAFLDIYSRRQDNARRT